MTWILKRTDAIKSGRRYLQHWPAEVHVQGQVYLYRDSPVYWTEDASKALTFETERQAWSRVDTEYARFPPAFLTFWPAYYEVELVDLAGELLEREARRSSGVP